MSAPGTDSSPQTATKASGFNYAELLSRILVLSLLLASAGLLWWSYYRVYVPRLVIFRDLSSTVDKLAREVEDLDRQWSKQDIERMLALARGIDGHDLIGGKRLTRSEFTAVQMLD